MNEGINEWINEWINEKMNEWMYEWMNAPVCPVGLSEPREPIDDDEMTLFSRYKIWTLAVWGQTCHLSVTESIEDIEYLRVN